MNLWQSRKFRAMVYDALASLVLFYGAKYLTPAVFEDIKVLIAALQPVVLAYILGSAWEDYGAKRAGNPVGPPEPPPLDDEEYAAYHGTYSPVYDSASFDPGYTTATISGDNPNSGISAGSTPDDDEILF